MSSNNTPDTPKFLYDSLMQGIQLCEKTKLIKDKVLSNKDNLSYKFFIDNNGCNDIKINLKVEKIINSASVDCSVVQYMKLKITSNSFPDDIYYAVYDGSYNTDNPINKKKLSNEIRSSGTFEVNDQNSYETEHAFFVVGDRSFIFCSKKRLIEDDEYTQSYNQQTVEKFGKILLLFLLAIAYNAKMDAFLKESIEIYNEYKCDNTEMLDNSEKYKKIKAFRESVYFFNLKYFFEFPVKQDRHEAFSLWQLISNTYLVKQKHDEINAQVADLTKIIVQNQNDKKMEEEREYQQQIKERDSKFEVNIAITGMVLAFAPILMEIINLYIKKEPAIYRTGLYILIIVAALLVLGRSVVYMGIKKLMSIIKKK